MLVEIEIRANLVRLDFHTGKHSWYDMRVGMNEGDHTSQQQQRIKQIYLYIYIQYLVNFFL